MKKIFVALVPVMMLVALGAADCAGSGMSPVVAVRGSVVNWLDQPVRNAKVFVTWQDAENRNKTVGVKTNKTGQFECAADVEGRLTMFVIYVLAKGYSCGWTVYPSLEGRALSLKLWPSYKLRGKVVDENGRPVSGAEVRLVHERAYAGSECVDIGLPNSLARVATNEDGSFSFDRLVDPRKCSRAYVDMNVVAQGRALVQRSFRKSDLLSGLKIVDPRECILEGTLYLPGKAGVAPPGTAIRVYGTDPISQWRDTTVGKNGKFRIAHLPPWNVTIALGPQPYFKGWDWALPAVTDIQLVPERTKSVELVMVRGALIKGLVLDRATGQPVGYVTLTAIHAGHPDDRLGDVIMSSATGNFQARVAPGDVTLSVDGVGDSWNDRPKMSFRVRNGQVKDVVFRITPPKPSAATSK